MFGNLSDLLVETYSVKNSTFLRKIIKIPDEPGFLGVASGSNVLKKADCLMREPALFIDR